MSNVIPFKKRTRAPAPPPAAEIDIITAVDAAIRDLRDIERECDEQVKEQAEECRRMLERALYATVGEF
jgi:hypothetical protein